MPESANYLLAAAVVPPVSLLLLALFGIALMRRRPRTGTAIAVLAISAVLVLATPWAAFRLIGSLEGTPLNFADARSAQAIVVLAGGRHRVAPEWGGPTLNGSSLQRLRYGAELARRTGLPLLLAGGSRDPEQPPEALLLRDVLLHDYGISARWLETDSLSTRENANNAAAILGAARVERVLLVTSAFHMPRAQRAFERAGISAIAAATDYRGESASARSFVPAPAALALSQVALAEWLALAGYRAADSWLNITAVGGRK